MELHLAEYPSTLSSGLRNYKQFLFYLKPKLLFSFVQMQECCKFFFNFKFAFPYKFGHMIEINVRRCTALFVLSAFCFYVRLQIACVADTLNFGPLISQPFLSEVS
jgi:hypothetical protein